MRRSSHPDSAGAPRHVRVSVLDHLLDDDNAESGGDALGILRRSVLRDLEALLNAQPPWRSVPAHMEDLRRSGFQYGLSNFTAEALHQPEPKAALLRDIESTIRRLEPRLTQIRVRLASEPDRLRPFLRFRIDATLQVEPIITPISFDTVVDVSTSAAVLQISSGG